MPLIDLSIQNKDRYNYTVLLIDDDEDDYILFREMLANSEEGSFRLEWASSFIAGKKALKTGIYDAVLMNYDLGIHSGIELIREANSRNYPAPILLLSGRENPEADIEALQAGAADYLHKDELNTGFLGRSIRYAIERRRLEQELDRRLQDRLDILESIQDGFFAINREWQITYINQKAAQNMDLTEEELVGKNILEAFPKMRKTPLEQNYRKVMEEGTPSQFEMRDLSKGQWYSISVYPAVDGISVYCQDITERKKVEEALRLSEARFNKAFNATPNALVISRQEDGLIQEVNDAFLRLFGYSREEVIGKSSLELNMIANPADREEAVKRLRNDNSVHDFEIDIRTKTGEIRQASLFVETIHLENAMFMLTIIIDNTERKRAEQELHQAHERALWLARFPNENPNPVVRVAADGRILYCNPVAQQLPGWECKDDQQISDELMPMILEALTKGKNLDRDVQLADQYYSISVMPFLSEKYANLYGRDITERKQAEAAQREAEERFRIALSNTSIAVFSTDLDLRYTWFYSTAMETMPERFIGKRDDEILPPETVSGFMDLKWRAIQEKGNVQEEIILDLGPRSVNLIVSVEPYYNNQGELIGVIGACFDVTEQRRLEQESMQHRTEMEIHHRLMEYREKERQEIARDLHDGPVQDLSSAVFNLQVLRNNIQEPVIQVELDQIRSSIKSVVQDLRNMMNELRPPSLIRFGLGRAIQNHIEDLMERHPTVKIKQELDLNENSLLEKISLSLFRIYQEAINNAIRHAEATKIWVRYKQTEDQAQLVVRDNGRGFLIPKEWGSQGNNGHFGLPGMSERADAIGGKFSITSKPGEGTTVEVLVPLRSHSE